MYRPSPTRPVRGKRAREMRPDTHFEPHEHAWAQIAYCVSGTLQVSVQDVRADHDVSYVVPSSRAVWIAPRSRHTVAVLSWAELHTLYVDPGAAPSGWQASRMFAVSPLLRELIVALERVEPGPREAHLAALTLLELRSAEAAPLGVPLPRAEGGDKRLRALCEAVLQDPSRHATLDGWARETAASPRTVARLFRQQLDTSFGPWRQQVLLAHALRLAAQGRPMRLIAAELGYASQSAFSAMFKRELGVAPSLFYR